MEGVELLNKRVRVTGNISNKEPKSYTHGAEGKIVVVLAKPGWVKVELDNRKRYPVSYRYHLTELERLA